MPMTHAASSAVDRHRRRPVGQPVEYKFFVNGTAGASGRPTPITRPDDDRRRRRREQPAGRDHLHRASPASEPGSPPPGSSTGATRSSTSSSSTASSTATPTTTATSRRQLGGHARHDAVATNNYLGGDWAGRHPARSTPATSTPSASTRSGSPSRSRTPTRTSAPAIVGATTAANCDDDPVPVLRLPRLLADRPATHGGSRAVLRHRGRSHGARDGGAREEPQGALRLRDGRRPHSSARLHRAEPELVHAATASAAHRRGCSDYDDYTVLVRPVPRALRLHATRRPAARTYSVNAALALVQAYGNDAFRLDAIKQVDPSWLAALRPQITPTRSRSPTAAPVQHFYMVGETYDFEDTAYIASFINPTTALDGQFDFPLRYRLVDAMLAARHRAAPELLHHSPTGRTARAVRGTTTRRRGCRGSRSSWT